MTPETGQEAKPLEYTSRHRNMVYPEFLLRHSLRLERSLSMPARRRVDWFFGRDFKLRLLGSGVGNRRRFTRIKIRDSPPSKDPAAAQGAAQSASTSSGSTTNTAA